MDNDSWRPRVDCRARRAGTGCTVLIDDTLRQPMVDDDDREMERDLPGRQRRGRRVWGRSHGSYLRCYSGVVLAKAHGGISEPSWSTGRPIFYCGTQRNLGRLAVGKPCESVAVLDVWHLGGGCRPAVVVGLDAAGRSTSPSLPGCWPGGWHLYPDAQRPPSTNRRRR